MKYPLLQNHFIKLAILCMYVGTVDYKLQDHRIAARFEKDGSRYAELKIEPINDNLVEQNEFYYLKIYAETLPNRVVTTNPATSKIIILDDDGK